MYELVVLGELMDQPLHGYALHMIANKCIGPFRQVSWGALYPLIRRLEERRFIEPYGTTDAENSNEGRQRKVYAITAAGRQRFFALMQEPIKYDADYPAMFDVKRKNFAHITADQQLEIVQQFRAYREFHRMHLEANARTVASKPEIPETERPHILRVINRHHHQVLADLAWIDAEIAALISNR